MGRFRGGLAAAIATALCLGCAGTGTSHPKLGWVRADGTPATREELEAAKKACLATTPEDPTARNSRMARHAYAASVVACIEGKGFQLVDEPAP